MAGTNNFQIWNPNANNQENDAAYTSDSLRANGAPSGAIFPSPTANKLFFQLSVMAYGLSQAMANKNYNISDSNGALLATVLGNIITNNDVPGNLVRWSEVPNNILKFADFTLNLAANHGYVKFPAASPFGGLMIQWGTGSASGGSTTYLPITFTPAFVNTPYIVHATGIPPTRSVVYVADASEGAPGGTTKNGAYIGTGGSVCACNWLAIGV